MGKRKITILESAAVAIAEASWFIESKGLPRTAKQFVDAAFLFFETLNDTSKLHRPCTYTKWKLLGYRCVNFKRKYVVAYMATEKEIIICEFVAARLLH